MISCICPTSGRAPHHLYLLEEAVESYLRQDRPAACELLILNDAPGQTLTCAAKDVRIVNVPERYPSLGAKYNAMVEMADGDLILPWEDDDLSLPWRIKQAVEMLGEADYWKPPQVSFWQGAGPPIFKHPVGVRHHASIFRREAWAKVGGYPLVSGNQDGCFDSLLLKHCKVAPEGDLPPREWAYCYRWSVSPIHLSGRGDHDEFYREIGGHPVAQGSFEIKPHWRRDYLQTFRFELLSQGYAPYATDNDHARSLPVTK